MEAYEVSTFVNSPRNDSPECVRQSHDLTMKGTGKSDRGSQRMWSEVWISSPTGKNNVVMVLPTFGGDFPRVTSCQGVS
jgi:hypothetical protein